MRRHSVIMMTFLTAILAVLCLTGCRNVSRDREEVLEASERFAEALMDGNTRQIKKLSDGIKDDDFEKMEMRITEIVANTAREKVTYAIDEDIEINGKEETVPVDITYTVKDEDRKIPSTMEFEKIEDRWLLVNSREVLEDFYKVIDALDIARPASESVQEIKWLYNQTDPGSPEYKDVDMIGCEIVFNGGFAGGDHYYTVKFNDSEVYKSDIDDGKFEAEFGIRSPGAKTNSAGHLESGTYVIGFYGTSDEMLLEAKCTVEQDTTPAMSVEGASSPTAQIFDTDRVESVKWWWYDSDSGDIITYTDSMLMHLDITFKPGVTGLKVYYEVTYEGFKLYKSDIKEVTEDEKSVAGVYLAIEDGAPKDANGHFAGGSYTVTFFDEAGNKLASDMCRIVGASTDDMEPVTKDDVDKLYWVGSLKVSDVGEFSNVKEIELDLILKDSAKGSPVRYSVSYNGSEVYSSLTGPQSSHAFYKSDWDDAKKDSNGNLAEGEYVITFYSSDGTEIATGKCTVKNS